MNTLVFFAAFALFPVISYAAKGCASGWIHYENKCYHFSRDKESMFDAMLICQQFGGSLAEIEGSTENDFLTTQANQSAQNYWIGLTDIQEEGIWQWYESKTELASSAVSDWAKGEPNNDGGRQNCGMVIAAGHWGDDECTRVKSYICEKEDMNVRFRRWLL